MNKFFALLKGLLLGTLKLNLLGILIGGRYVVANRNDDKGTAVLMNLLSVILLSLFLFFYAEEILWVVGITLVYSIAARILFAATFRRNSFVNSY